MKDMILPISSFTGSISTKEESCPESCGRSFDQSHLGSSRVFRDSREVFCLLPLFIDLEYIPHVGFSVHNILYMTSLLFSNMYTNICMRTEEWTSIHVPVTDALISPL